MRVGIIGGGAAGLVTAWLLDKEHDVVLFEKNNRLGGHAHTIYVPLQKETVPIEIGFEFFNQILFPHFSHLLTLLNIPIRKFPLTYTFHTRNSTMVLPPFSNNGFAWKMLLPKNFFTILQFNYLMKRGNSIVKCKNTTYTLEQFAKKLYLSQSFKDTFLYPFLSAGWGAEIQDFKTFAAYDIFKWIDETPTGLFPETWHEIINGTSSYINTLAKQLITAKIKLSASIKEITFEKQQYYIYSTDNTITECDHLIVATSPQDAYVLLKNISHATYVRSALNKIECFATSLAVHGDQNFMPKNKSDWSVTNVWYDGNKSAITVYKSWKSATPIFRSWLLYNGNKEKLPKPLYAIEHFHHQKVTPLYFHMQNELQKYQGIENLWLAGAYMHDIDSHESALVSALNVAEQLAPNSDRFKMLTNKKQ